MIPHRQYSRTHQFFAKDLISDLQVGKYFFQTFEDAYTLTRVATLGASTAEYTSLIYEGTVTSTMQKMKLIVLISEYVMFEGWSKLRPFEKNALDLVERLDGFVDSGLVMIGPEENRRRGFFT